MEAKVQRNRAGKFLPGSVANPGGKPAKTAAVRAADKLFESKALWAAQKTVRVAENRHGKYTEAAEMNCLQEVRDRAMGKVAPRDTGGLLPGVTIVVETIVCTPPPGGFPGVLSSPVPGHAEVKSAQQTLPLVETVDTAKGQ